MHMPRYILAAVLSAAFMLAGLPAPVAHGSGHGSVSVELCIDGRIVSVRLDTGETDGDLLKHCPDCIPVALSLPGQPELPEPRLLARAAHRTGESVAANIAAGFPRFHARAPPSSV